MFLEEREMIQHVTARVVDGELKPDESLQFPNDSRVELVIQSSHVSDEDRRQELERFLQFMNQHSVNDAEPFNREALYDRN